MSADHRRPFVAFVLLAVLATAIVGVHRAEAQPGRMLAAVIGVHTSAQGTLPVETGDDSASQLLVAQPARSARQWRPTQAQPAVVRAAGLRANKGHAAKSGTSPSSLGKYSKEARAAARTMHKATKGASHDRAARHGRAVRRGGERAAGSQAYLARHAAPAKKTGARSSGAERHAGRKRQLRS